MGVPNLPEGVDDLSGFEAQNFESNRRKLLDLYAEKGFEMVVVPMVENIESLLLTSESLNLKTFKFLDPISGKMLGVAADTTPQIARIDAKRASKKQEKYCYINPILQTAADDFTSSRTPIQAGAELYGSNDLDADIELIKLMLESLDLIGINNIVLSLGNVAIFNSLLAEENLQPNIAAKLRQIFITRSTPDLELFLQDNNINLADKFTALMRLEGGIEVLDEASKIFQNTPKALSAIKNLSIIAKRLDSQNIDLVFDLAELKVFEYHTELVFSAYHQNYSKALAKGGRYDTLSQSFGSGRAATGFSFDLKAALVFSQFLSTNT